MKNKQEIIKEKDFNYDHQEEYQKYKNIGSNSISYNNYCEWKKYILEKYRNVSIDSLINFKAYINKRARKNKHRKERITNYQLYITMIVAFIGILLTLFVTLQQNYSNIKQAIDNAIVEQTQTPDFSTTDKVIEIREKALNLQELIDSYSQTLNIVFLFSYITIIVIIVALIHYTRQLNIDNNELDFYNDYIKVIDEIISEKQNSSSSEDKA